MKKVKDKPLTFGQSVARFFGVDSSLDKPKDKAQAQYDPTEYLDELFPTKEKLVEGAFDIDWRDEVRAAKKEDWVYDEHLDEMRKRIVYVASKTSVNALFFKSPYDEKGGSTLRIEIRQASDRAASVAFIMSKGHISYNDPKEDKETFDLRFDDGDIENYVWGHGEYLKKRIIIYKDADKLIERIKNSSHLLINLPLYAGRDYNNAAFKFDVSDLIWDHKPVPLSEEELMLRPEVVGTDSEDIVLKQFKSMPPLTM